MQVTSLFSMMIGAPRTKGSSSQSFCFVDKINFPVPLWYANLSFNVSEPTNAYASNSDFNILFWNLEIKTGWLRLYLETWTGLRIH